MTHIVAAVKRHLRVSRDTHSVDALRGAWETLQQFKTGAVPSTVSGLNVSNELYVLCCEAAMKLGEWVVAEQCLKVFAGKRTPTKALEARALYCDGLVGLHNIPITCRGRAKVAAHLRCATNIVTGIKIVLEEWPKEAYTLTTGIEHLWLTIRDLFIPGTFDSIVDVVGFVVALHDKLVQGGPFSHLQWVMRYAVCLRGVGRHPEAAAQLSTASEMIAKVGSERLQLRFFRVQIAFSVNQQNTRPKQDYTKPVLQALSTVQSFFCGITDENTSRAELILAHDRLLSDPEKKEGKSKGRKAMETEVTFSDPGIVMDVLSEVVLGLALCGADEVYSGTLPKLLQSESVRPRLFGEYAQAVFRARACGALGAAKALDASYLTRSMADALFKCIRAVESTMDSARMIDVPSERSYTLEIGCVILWNLCLPLLQPETRGKLRHTLKRIALLLTQYGSNLTGLLVHVAYESALIEFEEDNLNCAIEQIDKALALDYFVIGPDGGITFPMDFALLWLRRRAVVRKAIDSSAFTSQEDQVIHLIEQARTAASASNRLVLLQSAANKLPPLGHVMEVNTVVKEKPPTQRERSKAARMKKHSSPVEPVEEQPQEPRVITNPSAANIYYLLLREAKEVKTPSVNPIIAAVANSLTQVDVINESDAKDLLVMKAEAHLSMAEVLTTSEKSSAATKPNSIADVMSHISAAAKIGVKLCAAGYREEWITVNASLSLINWYAESFRKGLFLPAAAALKELYAALNNIHIDPIRDFRLCNDIGFGYVMSMLQTYISSKGEVNGELSCDSLAETMRKTYLYPLSEANNVILRQAADACRGMMNKWQLPSHRKNFCLLDVCINRLLERNQEDSHHPQEQLLFLLGRLNGPMPDTDKRGLINKDCLELLRADPSVELCGRLATHSMQLPENERVTLELCRIADHLYQHGRLSWGTKAPISNHTGKEKGQPISSSASSATTAAGAATAGSSSNGGAGLYPIPSDDDWYWYAVILLYQATVLVRLGSGIERSMRMELEKRVLVAITNSAIAASHGPLTTQVSQISDAYSTFCGVADTFSVSSRKLLLPSLQILLSSSMLSKLRLPTRVPSNEGNMDRDNLCTILTKMGVYFLSGLSEKGAYDEGIKTMNNLLNVLPAKYHKVFRGFEAQFRCNLGLPTTQLLNKVKGGDPETEAAVWIAIARNAASAAESRKGWMRSLEVLANKPIQKADALLQMSEWMTARNAISRRDLTTLLLSALDCVEHFNELHQSTLFTGSLQGTPMRSVRQTLASSLAGRTLTLSYSASSKPGSHTNGGSAEPPSLRDVMIAIRIVYFLFVVAPETPCDGNSFAQSKWACASTILHYVLCLWRIVMIRVRMQENNPEDTLKAKPLELPEDLYGWQGFHADPQHADAIRLSCSDDAAYNTERLWGMLLEVCDFFVNEHMEQYSFIMFSWIEFCAIWRYNFSDTRAVAVFRAVHAKSLTASARCGCVGLCGAYQVEAPTAEYWSNIQEVLLATDAPPSSSLGPGGLLDFCTFGASTYHCVLIEAEELFALGRLQESLEWSNKVLQCAMRIGNTEAMVRCRLLELRVNILRGEGALAAENLRRLEEESQGLTLSMWTELNLTRFEALLSCQKVNEAIDLIQQLLQGLTFRTARIDEGVVKDVANDVVKRCHRRILRECARRFLPLLELPLHRFCWPGNSEEATKKILVKWCDQLQEFGDWYSRVIALRVMQNLRSYVNEFLLIEDASMGKRLMELLYAEYSEALEVMELIRQEMNIMVPLSMYTQRLAVQPSIATALDEVLVMLARNCLERELLKNFVLLRYHQLTMEQLGIPTGGPKELEPSVLQYMQDPNQYEQANKCLVQGGEPSVEVFKKEVYDPEKEVECALKHFNIPVVHVEGACSANAEAMLWRAAHGGEGYTPVRMEAIISASFAEFYRRLRALNRADDDTVMKATIPMSEEVMEEVRSREHEILRMKWHAPIVVPERSTGRRASRKTAVPERRKGKKETPHVEEVVLPPVNLWINEHSNLTTAIHLGVAHAQHLLDYKQMARCYICLAHTLMLSDEPCAAGTAVEFAQAAEMCNFLSDIHCALLKSSPEGTLIRLVERMKMHTPYLLNSAVFDTVRNTLINTSSMLKRFDLTGDWPAESNTPNPLPPDFCTFTIVREGYTPYFLVALRRPDGVVCSRRVQLEMKPLLDCGNELDTFRQLKKDEIVNKGSSSGGSLEVTCAPLLESIMESLEHAAAPLWEDFDDVLSWLAPTCNMFLCLDPVLQSLPLEQLSPFTQFLSVQRELSVVNIRHKLSLRVGKPSSWGTLAIVDPFGEHESSLQSLFGAESRPKASSGVIISSTKDQAGVVCKPSVSYVQRAVSSGNCSAVFVNMCGSVTDIVRPQTIAEMALDHIQVAFLTEGTNDRSIRREQKQRTSKTSVSLYYEKHFVVSLLLIARGVQYLSANILPLSPEESDAVSRRCLPVVFGGGKGLYEAVRGGNGEAADPCASAFVFYGLPPVGKQK
ncbi:hypothetical protein DQ04_00071130 [Trypanosoma grayi]|uniref:hypothetical protein n=1 Tax=Trypanosoma grayi TaxID=71804 RepID=UPI0004F49215|nr:hypothetical protein DQ04_00071130 [Trypanosoma grayi]KEG15445.1 hypothetical protein DQ04_00071130 [Trypanosoma grayi]